jgi:cyanophycin synthetase
MFDRAIVKEDDDRRGREPGEVAALIRQGWEQEKAGDRLQEILDEATAIETALEKAEPGDLVVIFPADVQRTIQIITRFQDKLNPKPSYRGSSYSIGPDLISPSPDVKLS